MGVDQYKSRRRFDVDKASRKASSKAGKSNRLKKRGRAVWRSAGGLSIANQTPHIGDMTIGEMTGIVYLIGAGPGDPGLLTLRGAQLLARADVVLYDGLSNVDILDHARDAHCICVGKHGQTRIWKQDEITAEMLRHARSGATVVRLKGGDPAVFARTAEEVDALRNAGIRFEIVPGITAALAASSYAGIPITHRKFASAVALVTGHEEPDKAESALDWDALARFPGTLVIYMGVTTASTWSQALVAAGKSPDTPVAILRRCSLADQQTVHCRLGDVAEKLTPATKMRPPVIVIIGEVTSLAQSMAWFESRPLFGRGILVTRAGEQAADLANPLRELGATVFEQPAITIDDPDDWAAVDQVIETLDQFDYLVFSSVNGVNFFVRRLLNSEHDIRYLAHIKIAAVGRRTADALAKFHLHADIVPSEFNAVSLAESLAPIAQGKHFAIVRASRGPDTMEMILSKAGGIVSPIVAYSHRDVDQADDAIRDAMLRGKIDWVTVTSNAIARSTVRQFGDSLQHTKIASLSPSVSETVRQLGYDASAEAGEPTMTALVQAISDVESNRE